jgi:hypothetical protein
MPPASILCRIAAQILFCSSGTGLKSLKEILSIMAFMILKEVTREFRYGKKD